MQAILVFRSILFLRVFWYVVEIWMHGNESYLLLLITVALIGYNGLEPLTPLGEVAMVAFIIISVVLIPMQINELSVLMSAHSIYRDPYDPDAMQHDSHVIVCGYVKNCRRIEKLLKELLHPSRLADGMGNVCNVVILNPTEPSEGMRALLFSSMFDSQVRYVVGSVLSPSDLSKARADIAAGVIFLCNNETTLEDNATSEVATRSLNTEESASILMQTLAIINYNPHANCLVQVYSTEDADVLKDSSVSAVLCLNEYKTVVQARNCTCPGFSALVENMFRTFAACDEKDLRHLNASKSVDRDTDLDQAAADETTRTNKPMSHAGERRPKYLKSLNKTSGHDSKQSSCNDGWIIEYAAGAALQPHFIPLPLAYLSAFSFEWSLLAEGIYLEFDCMLIGVCCPQDGSVIINPCSTETSFLYKYASKFYNRYSVGILLCENQEAANLIAQSLEDSTIITSIANKIIVAEELFRVRHRSSARNKNAYNNANKYSKQNAAGNQRPSGFGTDSNSAIGKEARRKALMKEIIRISKNRSATASELSQNSISALDSHSSFLDLHATAEEEFKGFVSVSAFSRISSNMGGNRSKSPQTGVPGGINVPPFEIPGPPSTSPGARGLPTQFVNRQRRRSSAANSALAGSLKQVRQSFRKSISVIAHSEELEKAKLSDEEDEGDGQDDKPKRPTAAPLLKKKGNIANELLNSTHALSNSVKLRHSESFNTSRSFRRRLNTTGDSFSDRNTEILHQLRENWEQKEAFANDLKLLSGSAAVAFDIESAEISDAEMLSNHIVVFGCMDNIAVFVNELRKPLIVNDAYHSVLIVSPTEPESWIDITDLHHDVYLIRADLTSPDGFNRANLSRAFSLCLLASRSSVTRVEGEDLDSEALFAYLKLEKHLPQHLFFTAELTIAGTMAVLNTTLMSRARGTEDYGLVRASSKTLEGHLSSRRASAFASNHDGEDALMTPTARRLSNASLLFNSSASVIAAAANSGQKKAENNKASTSNVQEGRPGSNNQLHGAFCTYRHRLTMKSQDKGYSRDSWRDLKSNNTKSTAHSHSHTTVHSHGERQNKTRIRIKYLHGLYGRLHSKRVYPLNQTHRNKARDTMQHAPRERKNEKNSSEAVGQSEKHAIMSRLFWTIADTQHVLPVFACGRAFAPTSFDSVMCQVEILKNCVRRRFIVCVHFCRVCFPNLSLSCSKNLFVVKSTKPCTRLLSQPPL
jgi:hypothetical protein